MNHAGTPTPAVPRPTHIPEAAVYDFDMFYDPAFLADRPPLQAAFLPKAMLTLKEHIRALASQLLDSVSARGRCEDT